MRLKHLIEAGAVSLATASVLVAGAMSAAAAPVTDPLGTGTSGTTEHGVDWTASRSLIAQNSGGVGLTLLQDQDLALTFGETVDLTFDVRSLQASADGGNECMDLPEGAVPVVLGSEHVWDAEQNRVCGTGSDATVASNFRIEGVTSFLATATGSDPDRLRGLWNLEVTVDRDEAVLVDNASSTTEDTPVTVDIQANDTIPDGSTGWEVDTATTQGGTVVDNGDGTVTYTPPAGFTGTDTFTYRVTGPDGVEVEATVTITVTEDEEPPVPMIAPAAAVASLLGGGAFLGLRRRLDGRAS